MKSRSWSEQERKTCPPRRAGKRKEKNARAVRLSERKNLFCDKRGCRDGRETSEGFIISRHLAGEGVKLKVRQTASDGGVRKWGKSKKANDSKVDGNGPTEERKQNWQKGCEGSFGSNTSKRPGWTATHLYLEGDHVRDGCEPRNVGFSRSIT